MAWSEKLPSGRYRGGYRNANGDKRYVKGTFTHKAKAVRAGAAMEDAVRRSMLRDPEAFKRPWGEWVEEWWPTRNVEPSTLRVDKGRLDRHLTPRWGTVAIGSITRQDVKAWAAEMRRNDTGPTTVQRCVHLLSASMVAAVDAEIVDSNPAGRIKLPGSAKAQERYLTHEEYAALREHMPTKRDRLVLDLLVGTGMRPGEAAGLHWNRVDLERGVVRVVETYDPEEGGQVKAYPKGKKVRDVPIAPDLLDVLREERKRRIDTLMAGCGVEHRVGKCRSSLVLTTETGKPLRVGNFDTRVFKPALEHAGVGHARVYDLRHTYASWLLQQGIPLAVVGQLLGHVSSQTTQIYAHLAAPPNAEVLAALRAVAAPRLPHAGDGSATS
jgi:integrase